jgi:hypothetical protein
VEIKKIQGKLFDGNLKFRLKNYKRPSSPTTPSGKRIVIRIQYCPVKNEINSID